MPAGAAELECAHASLPPPGSAQCDATELKCAVLACTLSPRMLREEARPSPTAPRNVNAFSGSDAREAARLCAHETSEHSNSYGATRAHAHLQHEARGACAAATTDAAACRVPRVLRVEKSFAAVVTHQL